MKRSVLKVGLNFIGAIKELIERMSKILKILDPIILPIAIPLFFLMAATAEVMSSGKEVPIAMIVSPIIFSLTPNCVANLTPLSTTN